MQLRKTWLGLLAGAVSSYAEMTVSQYGNVVDITNNNSNLTLLHTADQLIAIHPSGKDIMTAPFSLGEWEALTNGTSMNSIIQKRYPPTHGVMCTSTWCRYSDLLCEAFFACLTQKEAHCKPYWDCAARKMAFECTRRAVCDKQNCPKCEGHDLAYFCSDQGDCPNIREKDYL